MKNFNNKYNKKNLKNLNNKMIQIYLNHFFRHGKLILKNICIIYLNIGLTIPFLQ